MILKWIKERELGEIKLGNERGWRIGAGGERLGLKKSKELEIKLI